ncbi:LysM domain-containing protein [Limnohabitans sp.]|uniref:LysM peptidoglycan-binding domain-containing protein n=1 Tax=Limnohabitans sp. TaxID=1907725 RepID=UPI00286F5CA4|nr:LysM domain-containing protein [Limnohabitans sp.]
MRLDPSYNPQVNTTDASGMPKLPRSQLAYARTAPAFTRAMASASLSGALAPEGSTAAWSTSVRSGQTLTGIVREQMAARGVNISNNEAMRLAQTVARSNNIVNANMIHPGQQLNLESLNFSLLQAQAVNQAIAANKAAVASAAAPAVTPAANVNTLNAGTAMGSTALASTAQVQLLTRSDRSGNVVLEKTIDRAIEKGFIPAQDKQAVMNKIVQLSQEHRFAPDDFARLTLMESDGMNPKATNSRCHGIIQFCDGPERGAASAGFGANPKAILGHSVLQQLDMVGKYFDDTGLKNFGPVGLDDLYLTVLTPAARNETRPNAALNIPGQQAAYLHVNRDMRAPITRNSILAGLHQNANERLGTEVAQRPSMQAARLSAYAAQAAVTEVR